MITFDTQLCYRYGIYQLVQLILGSLLYTKYFRGSKNSDKEFHRWSEFNFDLEELPYKTVDQLSSGEVIIYFDLSVNDFKFQESDIFQYIFQ